MNAPTTCYDCGAALPVHPPGYCGGTGYAMTRVPRLTWNRTHTLPDGRALPFVYDIDSLECVGLRPICYACSAVLESETMTARGRTCLYLSREQQDVPPLRSVRGVVQQSRHEPAAWWRVSGWPGAPAFRIIGSVRCGWGYGFGRRYPVQTFRFAGPDGYVWSGRNAGDMQLARCRRTRERAR